MKHDRIASIVLFLVGAVVLREGTRMQYSAGTTMGPGFFPVWIGALMMLLSTALFLTTRRPNKPFIEDLGGFKKAALVGGSFVVFALAMEFVGMIASIAIYAAFLLGLAERRTWRETAATALLLSLACYLLFKGWLGLQLPRGIFGI